MRTVGCRTLNPCGGGSSPPPRTASSRGPANQWSVARGIEAFFEDAERRALALEPDEKTLLLERLQRAREVVGPVDALARLRQWKAPEER